VLYAPAFIVAGIPDAQSFTHSIFASLKRVALLLAMYNFLYYICHRDGLAAVHCRWSEASRAVIKKNLAWFLAALGPFIFFFILTEIEIYEHYEASLGRFSFIILMLLLAALFARVFGLRRGIAAAKLQHDPGSWLSRLKYLWYGAAVGVPLVFAGLAYNGYFYTALMLMRRTGFSIWVLVVAVVLNGLVLRWLLLARRRLALERNKEKNAGKEEANGIDEDSANASELSDDGGIVNVHDEQQVNLVQIDEQTRGLLRIIFFFTVVACLWAIWSQVLPALDLLDDIRLWSYQETVSGVVQLVPLTLGNLVWAIVLAVVAFVAARNLPGVLNITFFNHFNFDEGAKYALVTICRYIIVVVGVLVVVNSIGFRWESLQWLIAALGVGIGFGLQEIIANFICGLIILFERPFRLGDVVTSGDVTGKVTRIQIRATTITDWDRHELIVPNKEFITGRLINWTLADPIVRVIAPVGVAYGSDTLLVEQLLMKVAREAEIVLDDPEPRALFVGFGDSSLNFELRVFISGVNTLTTKHQLHMAIDREFRKAGVTISFPQRDVHVDSLGPIDVRVVPEKGRDKGVAD
jgi:potassium efflux system protein